MADQAPSYDDLYGPQATSKAPAPAPAAADPNAAPTYEDLYGKTPTVEELVVTGHRLAPPQDAPPQTPLGYAATTAGNIIPSAWNLIKGVGHTVAHPVQTIGSLGDIGGGVLQHGMNVATGGNAPQVFSTKTADAAGQMYKDRYWGNGPTPDWHNIAHTFEADPVGVLADLSAPLTGGGGAMVAGADALGTAGRVGEVANALRTVGNVVRKSGELANPANLVTKPLALPGAVVDKVVTPMLGKTTGAKSGAIRGAFNAGREGGESQQAFSSAIKGETTPQAIVSDASQKTDQMADMLRTHPDVVGANGDSTHIPLDDVKTQFKADAIGNRQKPPGYSGPAVGVGPSGEAVNAVGNILKKYDSNPALQSPQGLHSLIDEVTQYRDTLPKGSQEYNLANKTVDSVTDAIKDKAPFYAGHLQTIQDMRGAISDAAQAVQNGRGVDQSIIKIGEKAKPLATDLGVLPASTSGAALRDFLPHGRGSSALDIATTLGGYMLGHGNVLSGIAHAVPEMLASSPRVVGSTANVLGKVYGATDPVRSVIDQVGNIPLVKAGTSATRGVVGAGGRLNYTSPDGTVTLRDYMDNN